MNISVLAAVDPVQLAPQSVFAKDVAPLNMCFMFVTFDTSHLEISRLNEVATRNIHPMVVTLETSQFDRSLLNDVAPLNMLSMFVTFDTSHFEMSLLNAVALENINFMVVTLLTSHFDRSPMNLSAPGRRFADQWSPT